MRYEVQDILKMSETQRESLPQYILCHWRLHDGTIDPTRAQVVNLRDLKWGYIPPMGNEEAENFCNDLNSRAVKKADGTWCPFCGPQCSGSCKHDGARGL